MIGKSRDEEIRELTDKIRELTGEVTKLQHQIMELKHAQKTCSTKEDIDRIMTEINNLKTHLTPTKKSSEKIQEEILKALHDHNHIPTCELIRLLDITALSSFYEALYRLESMGKIKRYNLKGKKIICLTQPLDLVDEL